MTKVCSVCGEAVGQRNRTGMCERCRAKVYREENREAIAARNKVYREENREAIAARKKVYNAENKEAFAACKKVYYEENREVIAACKKVYYEENREVIVARSKVYYEENREVVAAKRKVYYEENREVVAARSKVYNREHPHEARTYLLSFSDPDCHVWNKWFPGSEGHHLTWDEGIYIPKDLHRSIYHSINRDKNMEEINIVAMEWFHSGEIPGSKYVQTSLCDIGNTIETEASV